MSSNCNCNNKNPITKIEIPVYSRDDFFEYRYTLNQILMRTNRDDETTFDILLKLIDRIDSAELYYMNEYDSAGNPK